MSLSVPDSAFKLEMERTLNAAMDMCGKAFFGKKSRKRAQRTSLANNADARLESNGNRNAKESPNAEEKSKRRRKSKTLKKVQAPKTAQEPKKGPTTIREDA